MVTISAIVLLLLLMQLQLEYKNEALVTWNSEYQSEGKVKILFEGIFKEYVGVYESGLFMYVEKAFHYFENSPIQKWSILWELHQICLYEKRHVAHSLADHADENSFVKDILHKL